MKAGFLSHILDIWDMSLNVYKVYKASLIIQDFLLKLKEIEKLKNDFLIIYLPWCYFKPTWSLTIFLSISFLLFYRIKHEGE